MSHGSAGRIRLIILLSFLVPALGVWAAPTPRGGTHRPLRPGDLVRAEGLSLVVPRAGDGVWASAEDVHGQWRTVGVKTAPNGSVTVVKDARALGGSKPTGARTDPCSDNAYTLYSSTWKTTDKWFFNSSTTPSEVTVDNATSALRAAADNITHADNDCGLADNVSAKHAYQGTTTKTPNMGTDASCQGSDGSSVVAFGDLPSADLAFTCWWMSGNDTIEADIRLNKFEYSWVVNIGPSCVTKYSVEAVATHEFGHAFGLGHVSEVLHGSLTMSPVIMTCQSSEKTLGLGDVLGLQAQY